jgi:hypothetical protein
MRLFAASATTALLLFSALPSRAGPGLKPLDLAPYASLDVSPFTADPKGFSELTAGPGTVRDGDPTTAWEVPGDSGATMTFDWSNPGDVEPFVVGELVIDTVPPGVKVAVAAGRDRASLADVPFDAEPGLFGLIVTLHGGPLRVLQLRFPAGTAVQSVTIHGGPTTGTLGPVKGTCDDDGVHLALSGKGLLGVEAVRSLPGGGVARLSQRRTRDAVLTDASVRFDARPATYSYVVHGIGSSEDPVTVEVTCSGEAKKRLPAGPIHGVIEGFYGRPWTWHEREKVVLAMGALGMDTYIYAPKLDPEHRAEWRRPYDDDAMAHFKALADIGKGVGVNVVWAISPGMDIDPQSQTDIDALLGKVESLAKGAGIRDSALLMDDIAMQHSAALGAAHAALAQTLLASMKARDPASRLWFVPSVYAGFADKLKQEDHDYLAALSALPAEVPLAWTGEGVFSKSIQLTDVAAFGAVLGRDAAGVWVWDNYPVNDIELQHRLHTHPITGRESLLPGSAGLLSNPMRHALASIPAIASYAELSLDPAGYAAARAAGKPLGSAALALVLADAEHPPAALGHLFAELLHHDALWPDEKASPDLTQALAAWAAATTPGAARHDAAFVLGNLLGQLAVADVDLRRDLDDTALSDEIDPYARVASLSARAALLALSGDRAEILKNGDAAKQARSGAACAWEAADSASWRTIQEAVAPLLASAGSGGCAAGEDPYSPEPVYAALGQRWSFDAPDDVTDTNVTTALVGPPEAAVSATGHIDWTPSHLGPHRLVVLRSGDAGLGARIIDVTVVETVPGQQGTSPGGTCGCRAAGGGSGSAGPLAGAALDLLAAWARGRGRRRRRRRREQASPGSPENRWLRGKAWLR